MAIRPNRLNLAIAKRCHVSCDGCYTYFGRDEPDLRRLIDSTAAFARLGLVDVTLSGGDPLTVKGLMGFLTSLRAVGVQSIKLDTVGVGLASGSASHDVPCADLVGAVDYLAIALDGWSNDSALDFRRGRQNLHAETLLLLDHLDSLGRRFVIINTVAHRLNLEGLARIGAEVTRHRCVCQWNVFQYTPTDQARSDANQRLSIGREEFLQAREHLLHRLEYDPSLAIEFRSNEARLGQYLLINSDGEAWLPDHHGNTVRLGSVFGKEAQVLERWSEATTHLMPGDALEVHRAAPRTAT